MAGKQLLDYIQKTQGAGYSKEQIHTTLVQQGWSDNEISEAFTYIQQNFSKTIPIPTPPKKSEWDINLKSLSASQVFLYSGGLIIFIAGILYIGINWQQWNSLGRIFAIFLPMTIMFGIGITLWYPNKYRKQALFFIFTGALLFPLFLTVTFKELNLFKGHENSFLFAVSFLTLCLYLILNFTFKFSGWMFLCTVSGVFTYYYLLKVLGVEKVLGENSIKWALLPLGFCYIVLGYYYEKIKRIDFSQFLYLVGNVVIGLSLIRLSSDGSLLKTSLLDFKDMVGWSFIFTGFLYLSFSYIAGIFKKMGFKEFGNYVDIYDFAASIFILLSTFILSLAGKKPFYETLILIFSLTFIFASIPKSSRVFLYVGSIFLVIYIFDIGGEYFQNQVGWPITLFIAGLISMVIGFIIEKVRRQYFINKV